MARPGDRLQGAAAGTVVTAVALSPWLFGSAEPWAYLSICLLIGIGAVLWILSILRGRGAPLRAPAATLALAAVLAFVFLQMLPLPRGFARALSPASAKAQLDRIRLFSEIAVNEFLPSDVKDNPACATISVSAASTRRSFYLLAAYIGVFLVMANACRGWRRLRGACTAIVISSFVMALFALVQKSSGANDIYWFHTPRFGGEIFGPYPNRNHFASYVNMALGLGLGLLLAERWAPESRTPLTWREKVAWFSTEKGSRIVLLGLATTVMGAAVCLSLSRAGLASLAVALGVVGGFVAMRSGEWRRGGVIAALALLVAAMVIWLGLGPVMERMRALSEVAGNPFKNTRAVVGFDTLRLFCAFAPFGCGFGGFQHAFPLFQSPSIQVGRFVHAHNDYAQLLAEGGVIGTGFVVLGAVLLVQTVRNRLRSAETRSRLLMVGVAAGIVTIAIHSLLDYGLHKPANAFLLAALCGISVAAVHLRPGEEEPAPPGLAGSRGQSVAVRGAIGLAVLAGIAALGVAEIKELRGETAFARFLYVRKRADNCTDRNLLAKAVEDASAGAKGVMSFGRGNPDALQEVAMTCLKWSENKGIYPLLGLRCAETSVRAAALAVRAAPSDYEPWLCLARAQSALGLRRQVDLCLARAQELAPPGSRLNLAGP